MGIRAVLLDVFGTLLDVHSVAARVEQLFPGNGSALSQLWREKQLEYTRLRTLCDRYVPFTQVTEDALLYACDALHLPLDAASRGLLMHEYTQLSAFSDVVPALRRIQHLGVTLGVLSNGDPGLLEDALHSAQLDEYFDVILSVDQVRAYKTSPLAYGLGPQTLGCPAGNIFFVSSNGWDASCATWYGYRTCWVNRKAAPAERLGAAPHVVGRTLETATEFLQKELQPAT